jgi:flavin reductase (DIM6/NTAB) family NADH-FMN oxidoreductase RutF
METTTRCGADLWKCLSTTVGLVGACYDGEINIMAAEWTYFLNKNPLYVAVSLSRRSITRDLIQQSGEFSVTLCAESQADIANFVGSFSGRDIDKSSCAALDLRAPAMISTPWVAGGVAALECEVRQVIPLPDYLLIIGEAVAVHREDDLRPLIKHGPMYALGETLGRTAVVAAAHALRRPGDGPPVLRVAATGRSAQPGLPWRLTLEHGGSELPLGEYMPDEHGDLMVDIDLPQSRTTHELSSCRVRIECDDLKPGWARVSTRRPLSVEERPVPYPG